MNIEQKQNWQKILSFIEQTTGKKPKDLNGVLYLIGVQELGKGSLHFTKEEKQDLLHIAICKVLSGGGFYELDFVDSEGWPHYKNTQALPKIEIHEQEHLLKSYIIDYFRNDIGLHI